MSKLMILQFLHVGANLITQAPKKFELIRNDKKNVMCKFTSRDSCGFDISTIGVCRTFSGNLSIFDKRPIRPEHFEIDDSTNFILQFSGCPMPFGDSLDPPCQLFY